jgi:hypothetical protein
MGGAPCPLRFKYRSYERIPLTIAIDLNELWESPALLRFK